MQARLRRLHGSDFYPRSPCGERRSTLTWLCPRPSYFYPRSPCGERRAPFAFPSIPSAISIHALRVESDQTIGNTVVKLEIFLSTLSVWRATLASAVPSTEPLINFYPRSPCGERRRDAPARPLYLLFLSTLSVWRATRRRDCLVLQRRISIHALRVESDGAAAERGRQPSDFYPRSPCGERQWD